jgi:hypothetical protein
MQNRFDGIWLANVSLAFDRSAGLEHFRQPLDLVSHWLTGFSNCPPTQGKLTNAGLKLDSSSKQIRFIICQ